MRDDRQSERGSALVLTLMVMVILSLLGVSFILTAEDESRISVSERSAAQAQFAAEAGVHLVQKWFNDPDPTTGYALPDVTEVDRTRRWVDDDQDGTYTHYGSASAPYNVVYRQGIDDLFEKEYRGNPTVALEGTEGHPDVSIYLDTPNAAMRTYLEGLNEALFENYPSMTLQARIDRIDIYAPPVLTLGAQHVRYGIASVKVTASLVRAPGSANEKVLATRTTRAVLNEIPFPKPFGPLHSCRDLSWNGEFSVHWGVATAVNASDLHNNHEKQPASLPRAPAGKPERDLLWAHDSDADFAAYKTIIDGLPVDDPWFRYLSGEGIVDAPNANLDPYPFTWSAGNPLGDGHLPYHPDDPSDPFFDVDGDGTGPDWDGNHNNQVQNFADVGCPELDYEFWKDFALRGGANVHYYTWESDDLFRENGTGPVRSFRSITDGQQGVFFFDTADGRSPRDDDGDGLFDNLTPGIKVSGGVWGTQGIVYLNAEDFQTTGITGRDVVFRPPGEPFQDRNLNGEWDTGEDWINLDYPTALKNDPFLADSSDTLQDDGTMGTSAVRNSRGPGIVDDAVVEGILYTNGFWDASGNGRYSGSVITKSGVGQSSPSAGNPDLYWDQTIAGEWPPKDWKLPRIYVTEWETPD